jgi:hypothetical protein
MTVAASFLNRLRARGEEVLTQVSAELASDPRFMKAMAGALRGKERLEHTVGQALRQMNVPSRSELKRALARIEALEREVSSLKAKARARARPAKRRPAGRKPAASPRSAG